MMTGDWIKKEEAVEKPSLVQAAKPTTTIQIDTLKPQQATPKQSEVEFSSKFH